MNPLIELALVLAMFAALVGLSYAMHWLHERRPVVEVVPEDAPALPAFAPAVTVAPDPWGHPFGIEDEDEDT